MNIEDDFLLAERKRKKIFAVIGITLIFSLAFASMYSANGAFVNLNDEVAILEADMFNLQNILNSTYVELGQTRSNLNQSVEERLNLQGELDLSIEEKATLQNTLDLTEAELLGSIERTSTLQDKLNLTSPPTAVTKTNISRLLALMYDRFNLSGIQIHTMDKNYSLTNKSEIDRFLSRDVAINEHFEYVTDVYDCDDFALRTYGKLSIPGWSGLAIGIASFETGNNSFHMTLLFFDIDEKIWMIDYSKVKEIPEDWILRYVLI